MIAKEWFSAAEIAELALPGMPGSKRGVAKKAAAEGWAEAGRPRGPGVEFHYSILPTKARLTLVRKFALALPDAASADAISKAAPRIEAYTRANTKQRQRADFRFDVLREIEIAQQTMPRTDAIRAVAASRGIGSVQTIYNWLGLVGGIEKQNTVAALVPGYVGGGKRAECSDEAWNYLLTLYLRLNKPPLTACFREVRHQAAEKGWKVPSRSCLERRIESDVPEAVRVLYRDGDEALKRLFPAQERDRSMFHALECVNADGHKWDLRVRWPDGSVHRPMMVAFQDLYSNLILSWRVDKSENKEMVRLAFGDMVDTYGIPEHCWLDNGRGFASKWLTGGIANRFRFKIREEDPHGILPLLGVKVHWTKPYSGQSKPIERAFGEFASNYAKHPKFDGAGTGNSTTTKPANYGDKVIPLDVFLEVAATCIAEHNSREGRKTKVCGHKLSFQQAFNASYSTSIIRKADAEHRQLWLLAAEGVTARAKDGAVHVSDNRYWAEELHKYRGQKVVVRFDPQALLHDIHVYSLDGTFICKAVLQGAARFDSADEAREQANAYGAFRKGVKMQAEALVRISRAEAAAMTRTIEDAPAPETKVVRPTFGNTALRARPAAEIEAEEDEYMKNFERAVAMQRAARGEHLQLLETEADPDE